MRAPMILDMQGFAGGLFVCPAVLLLSTPLEGILRDLRTKRKLMIRSQEE